MHRKWWLYVLKLENGKWYVGITSKHPEERFQEHRLGKMAAYWTMLHKPIEIEFVEELGVVSRRHAEKYENKITRQLMRERGLNNVRGGDLRDAKDYIMRFGRIYDMEGWEEAIYILTMLIIFLAFIVDKYLFVFIPGGVR